jgi:predicted NAD-dependent protein-ADP-ribosyltransferase YbiA (DUF1768 family)
MSDDEIEFSEELTSAAGSSSSASAAGGGGGGPSRRMPSISELAERASARRALGASGASAAGGGGGGPSRRPAVAAAAPAAAAATPSKKKRPAKGTVPYPTDSAGFFKARATFPSLFNIDENGDLTVPANETKPAKIILLPNYRQSSYTEREEYIEERRKELKQVELEFFNKKKALRELMTIWLATKSPEPGSQGPIIELQKELAELDAARAKLQAPNRFTKTYEGLSLKKIIISPTTMDTKIKEPVLALVRRPTTFEEEVVESEEAWKKTMTGGARKAMEDQEAAGEGPFAGIEENENERLAFGVPGEEGVGLLSLDNNLPFTFEATKYQYPLQAYHHRRMTNLGGDSIKKVQEILQQTTAAGVRTIGTHVVGHPDNAFEILKTILEKYIQQHPEVRKALLETGETELVNIFPAKGDLFLASGLTEETLDSSKDTWPGKNMLGKVWMKIREELIASGAKVDDKSSESFFDTGYTSHAKTQQEAMKERLPFIIAAKRRA